MWNNIGQIPDLLMDSGNAYIYTSGIAPAEQVNLATGTITYLDTDLLGSVRGVVNASGGLTGTSSYDAWGNPQGGGLTATTPFGFAGGYTDPTGLIYLVKRYYDPQTGQLLSVDPALSQTQQPYGYASGNPVSMTDPTGMSTYIKFHFWGPTLYLSEWFMNKLWWIFSAIATGSLGAHAGEKRIADWLKGAFRADEVEIDLGLVDTLAFEVSAALLALEAYDWDDHGVAITWLFWNIWVFHPRFHE